MNRTVTKARTGGPARSRLRLPVASRATIPVALGLVALSLITPGSGVAQSAASMRERVYDKLSQAEKAAEEGRYEDAHEALRKVEKLDDLSTYEKAQLFTAKGFALYMEERLAESIDSYRQVLEQDSLPEALETGTLYTLAQLQFQAGDYEGSVEHLDRWLATAIDPGPEAHLLRSQGLYQLRRHGPAIASLETALEISRRKGREIPENWYLLLRVLQFESKRWEDVVATLEILVTRFPKKEYWVQLAAMYGRTGAESRQLAAYEVAYLQGFLEKSEEIEIYAQLLLQDEVPFRAARILEKGLADGTVADTVRNLRLLSQAWSMAQEHERAIAALTKAAGRTEDGELDARLAQALLNVKDWERAAESAREALRKGVEREGDVHVMLGMALYEMERRDEAKSSFERALAVEGDHAAAAQWVGYLEAEQHRLADLERSLP
jgi:tetratricopeptide (TPR) repeat protein